MNATAPSRYEAWYHTPRGEWSARREFDTLWALMRPAEGESLLDVGAGTGHFSRRFTAAGLRVTGLDSDPVALAFARTLGPERYLEGDARALPFADGAFDWCAAVTSLCFVPDPEAVLAEMWRVARRGVVLGLLHRPSLLHRRKAGRGGYTGARWDNAAAVRRWAAGLRPPSQAIDFAWALYLPGGGRVARGVERLIPSHLPWGGFLAAVLRRPLAPPDPRTT